MGSVFLPFNMMIIILNNDLTQHYFFKKALMKSQKKIALVADATSDNL
jgi:hypothetical protein